MPGQKGGKGRECHVTFLWSRKPKFIKSCNGSHGAKTSVVQEIVRADYNVAVYSKSKFCAYLQIVACNPVEGKLAR